MDLWDSAVKELDSQGLIDSDKVGIIGFSRMGVEFTKRMLWSSLDAGSLHAQMDHETHAQLFVRLTTENFEEAMRARKEGRPPIYLD